MQMESPSFSSSPGSSGWSYSEPFSPPLQLQLGGCGNGHANFIGLPVYFAQGRFAGETIYAELSEIQKPEFGRRFGAVDRRVLDDPPVVLLRLFRVSNVGTAQECMEEVVNYGEIALAGLMCMVDLFEITSPGGPMRDLVPGISNLQFSNTDSHQCTGWASGTAASSTASSSEHSTCLAQLPTPPDSPTAVDGYVFSGSSKRTTALFGTTFVEAHAVTLPCDGKPRLMFTFSDLAVRSEGRFVLRYRFFDLLSSPAGYPCSSVLAEHYGKPFTVYSTKTAPALSASTELTLVLSQHSVPVNIRKKPRAPRRKLKQSP